MARKPTNWKQVCVHYLYDRDGGICRICGEMLAEGERLDVDHIIPVSEGGTDDIKNLSLVHTLCHLKLHTPQKNILKENVGKVTPFKKAKRDTTINTLRMVKRLYTHDKSLTECAKEVGWTFDQYRYYVKISGFSGKPDKWNFKDCL